MTLQPNQTTREIALRYPEVVPVFESLGIDYCCGGIRTLEEACRKAQVEWDQLIRRLDSAKPDPERYVDWAAQPVQALTRHILQTHHRYIRGATPQIQGWLEKVAAKHSAAHPEVLEIRAMFSLLSAELSAHMMKEEQILFPYLDGLDAASPGCAEPPRAGLPSVAGPIRQMMAEHDSAGELLAKIRAVAAGYQPPADACPTYRALYHGLAEFERDLHQHVHLENNILFPRALRGESGHAAA